MIEESPLRYVGQPLRRREDLKFVTGKGRYVDDVKLPDMLHMAILRSPHAHAKITRIDLSEAMPRRAFALCCRAATSPARLRPIVPNWIIPGTKVPFRPVVAIDRVSFVGECVALVVAETPHMAYDALGLIEVDYETLPAVVDEVAAIRDGAPLSSRQCPRQCHHGVHSWRRRLPKSRQRGRSGHPPAHRQQPPDPDLHGNPCRHRGPER